MPFYVLPTVLTTSEEEVLALHNDVPEYQKRLTKADAHILHDQFAKAASSLIASGDQIADIGVGVGTVAQILVKQGHMARRVGNDISKPYLSHVFNLGLYDDAYLGTAEDFVARMRKESRSFGWVTLVSVCYYFSPERLSSLLVELAAICRKGVILSLDGIPDELIDRWRSDQDKPVTVYNHRGITRRLLERGYASSECVWSDIGWASSLTGLEVPVDLVVLRTQPTR